MSMGFIKDGKYVQVAGNPPPSGELVMGASTIRKGSVTLDIPTLLPAGTWYADVAVTFDSPMPDDTYVLDFHRNDATLFMETELKPHKFTKNGFNILVNRAHYVGADAPFINQITVHYTAAKLYTVEGVEELEAKVAEHETKLDAIGSFSYSNIMSIVIPGQSTTPIQTATNVTLKAGCTYMLGLHISQNPTDGGCTFTITDATGTPISYWENSITAPIGTWKSGQTFPVKFSVDTTLGIQTRPYAASTGSWAAAAEISWCRIS